MSKRFALVLLFLLVGISQVNADPRSSFLNDTLADQLADQLSATLKVKNDPEMVEAHAKYIRSLYQALIKQGFTKDEALTLVSATLAGQSDL